LPEVVSARAIDNSSLSFTLLCKTILSEKKFLSSNLTFPRDEPVFASTRTVVSLTVLENLFKRDVDLKLKTTRAKIIAIGIPK